MDNDLGDIKQYGENNERIKIKDVEYKISYCSLCKDIVIVCLKCKNSSCNGGGCDSCHHVFKNSDKYLKAASIPGELCYKMSLELHIENGEFLKQKIALERKIKKLEKQNECDE